jgi:hypothetical protein
MKNNIFFLLSFIFGSLVIFPNFANGQACPGSSAEVSVKNAVRVSTNVFEFDIFLNNSSTNGTTILTSGVNGAVTGFGTPTGTFTVVDIPLATNNAPTGALTLSTPTVSSMLALRVVQTATTIANGAPIMPTVATKFARFRFTRSGGSALPTGDFTLSWVASGGAAPSIVAYCSVNTNSTSYNVANLNLTVVTALVLPIELTDFDGETLENTNMLHWQTGTEVNVKEFEIQRSTDGQKNWQLIGTKPATGNSTTAKNYSLEDRNPLQVGYYRLRSKDFDGKEQMSEVLVLTRNDHSFGIASAFPIPTSDKVNVQFETLEESTITMRITDIAGRLVSTQKMDATNGINSVEISLASLQAGAYFLTLDNGSTISAPTKVVKQ